MAILAAISVALFLPAPSRDDPALGVLLVLLRGQVPLAIWIAGAVLLAGVSLRFLFGGLPVRFNWWAILVVVPALIVYSVAATWILLYPIARFVLEKFPAFPGALSIRVDTPEATRLTFIALVFIAPLMEEIAFRGLLFSRWSVKWGKTRAMLASSAAFGALHLPLNPIGAFVFGLMACALYMRTRTLLVPITLHALNNLVVFLLVLLTGSPGEVSTMKVGDLADGVYVALVAMLLASPFVFGFLGRWWSEPQDSIPYQANRETATAMEKDV
ncbi:MAG: CPBP family intramembrane metalloprotease [Chloroflexi bacterium]|nr:CPBP family intramembrane metalloprotease [Chloroflexota bacterium]